MRDIADVMLAVHAHAYSFEAGNVRHEHEWKVWQDIKLPDDKVILPGVVSHATNVVEHPRARRRSASFASRTSSAGKRGHQPLPICGLGGRVHPRHRLDQNSDALTEGAALATRQVWR